VFAPTASEERYFRVRARAAGGAEEYRLIWASVVIQGDAYGRPEKVLYERAIQASP
jgi:hypothetical protein